MPGGGGNVFQPEVSYEDTENVTSKGENATDQEGENVIDQEIKNFICQYCDKSFIVQILLS